MKWGVRRFQNTDGSLTNAGKARYGSGKTKYKILAQSPFEKKRAKLDEKERRMTEKEEIQRRKNELRERQANLKNIGKKTTQEDATRENRLEKERKRDNREPKYLTDDELRAVINRYKLEKEYLEIMKGPEKKTGAKVVADILIKSGQQALGEASKAYMTGVLKKYLGLKDEDKKKKKNNDD